MFDRTLGFSQLDRVTHQTNIASGKAFEKPCALCAYKNLGFNPFAVRKTVRHRAFMSVFQRAFAR